MPEGFTTTYREVHQVNPPARVEVGGSAADVLSVPGGFMGGFDLSIQLQVGCPGGCLFCYVPAGRFLAPATVTGPGGRDWGYRVRHKYNALEKFVRHLDRGDLADRTLYWSGVTDPYASPPMTTAGIWQALCTALPGRRPRRLVVQTRFPADRDVRLMAEYAKTTQPGDGGPPVVISVSIGTDREDLIRAWERATPTYARRLETIQVLCRYGLYTVATLSPLGLWDDLPAALSRLHTFGVAYLTVLPFKERTRSANTPRPFLEYLRREFPLLLDEMWQAERLAEARAVFGDGRVIVGQAGFATLATPQNVMGQNVTASDVRRANAGQSNAGQTVEHIP